MTAEGLYRWNRQGGLLSAGERSALLTDVGNTAKADASQGGALESVQDGIARDGRTVFGR
jgi:hypothetical protein